MKKILSIIVGFLVLILLATAGVVFMINPNDFKPLLTEEVKKATGQDLIIEGDIRWEFWPNIGLSVEKLRFKNEDGFAEPDLLKIERVQMSVAVLPLLSEELDIGVVYLEGAHVFIQTLPNGVNNLDPLFENAPKASSSQAHDLSRVVSESPLEKSVKTEAVHSKTEQKQKNNWSLRIEGFDFRQASATVLDDKSKTRSEISSLDFNMGLLKWGSWVPVSFEATGKQNENDFNIKGDLELSLSKEINQSQLRHVALTGGFKNPEVQLDDFSLGIEAFKVATPSRILLSMKGKAKELSFDNQTQTDLFVDETFNQIMAKDFSAQTTLSGKTLPKEKLNLGFKGDVEFNREKNTLLVNKLHLNANEITLMGLFSVVLSEIPSIHFDLRSPKIDMDAFLSSEGNSAPELSIEKKIEDKDASLALETPPVQASKAEQQALIEQNTLRLEKGDMSDQEPDLSALHGVSLSGKIAIDALVAQGIVVEKLKTTVLLHRGKLTVSPFLAHIYGGTMDFKAILNAEELPASYQLSSKVKNVSIQPLLFALTQKKWISGKGNIDFDLSGKGLSERQLKKKTKGVISIDFSDGAIEGFNIAEMVRQAKAALKGQKDDEGSTALKTDFSALSARFYLENGVASTKDLKIEAPAIRVSSQGETHLLEETLDFNLNVSVVGSSKGQGGKDIDELKDVTVPVTIGGTWTDPQFNLDLKSLLQNNKKIENKVRKELDRGLNKYLGEGPENDKIKDAANKFLNNFFK